MPTGEARAELARANHLLRGIRIRNFGMLPNYFFDDMAWLALASGRLAQFTLAVTGEGNHAAQTAMRVLGEQLQAGMDEVLGGGLYWSKKRDFKNTPANAPAFLICAANSSRSGQVSLRPSAARTTAAVCFEGFTAR